MKGEHLMARKGENIYKRKDGRWEGRQIYSYNENGKAKYKYVYAHSYAEVRKKMKEANTSLSSHKSKADNIEITFGELSTKWLERALLRVKDSTFARYFNLIEKHINPRIGKYKIYEINFELIEKHINDLLSNGKLSGQGGLSPKSVQDIFIIIKSILKYSNENHNIRFNEIVLKKADNEMRVLTKQEQMKLNKFLLTNVDSMRFGVLLSLYTGIRIGELCALRWENINIAEQTLFIKNTMQRIQNVSAVDGAKTKVVITPPKSKYSIRSIPLPDFLMHLIVKLETTPKAFILSEKKDRFIEPRTVQNRFKSYVESAGISHANFHALRHTFATRCVELGFEIKSLSEILGHANVNITLNCYVHSSFDFKKQNMNKLSSVANY